MDFFVYALCDPRNQLVYYIGKTNDLQKRFQSHVSAYGGKSKKNSWIKSLKKTGLEPELKILEICSSDVVDEKEIYWISIYKKLNPNLKNMTKGGTGGTTHLGKRVPIKCSNGQVFSSIKEASRCLNISSYSICNILYGRANQTKNGLQFKLINDQSEFKTPPPRKIPNAKTVYCSNGKTYSSANQAARELNLCPKAVSACINKKYHSTRGLHFWLDNNSIRPKKITGKPIYCPTNGLTYSSARQAAKELGLCFKQISQVIRAKQKTVKGYTFVPINIFDGEWKL
ncbi:MAG: GIY-YIG nuclease family protein [Proteobacteria bacterium]|nr:GIY-YIG nuclease family protein [Pseudomonadota bacterium]